MCGEEEKKYCETKGLFISISNIVEAWMTIKSKLPHVSFQNLFIKTTDVQIYLQILWICIYDATLLAHICLIDVRPSHSKNLLVVHVRLANMVINFKNTTIRIIFCNTKKIFYMLLVLITSKVVKVLLGQHRHFQVTRPKVSKINMYNQLLKILKHINEFDLIWQDKQI